MALRPISIGVGCIEVAFKGEFNGVKANFNRSRVYRGSV